MREKWGESKKVGEIGWGRGKKVPSQYFHPFALAPFFASRGPYFVCFVGRCVLCGLKRKPAKDDLAGWSLWYVPCTIIAFDIMALLLVQC